MLLYKILLVTFLILLLDILFIGLNKSMWETNVQGIQGSPLKLNFKYSIIAYILIILGVCIFVLPVKTECVYKKMFIAFMWGLITYGIFDFTNLSLFKDYNLNTAITDTLWGGILISVSVGIAEYVFSDFEHS